MALEFIVPETVSAFATDTDADLLAYMAMRDDDPVAATAAYAEFYTRHVKWLFARLSGAPVQRLLGGPACVPEFVQDTFQKAFEQAATFAPEGIADPVRLRHRARAWLGAIGNRLMLDGTRPVAPGLYEVSTADLEEEPDLGEIDSSGLEMEVMREVLEGLGEREQDVLLDWTLHYKPGVAHQRLSNAASAELAQRWATTPENIRAIRKRTMDKVRVEVTRRLAEYKVKDR